MNETDKTGGKTLQFVLPSDYSLVIALPWRVPSDMALTGS